VDAINKLALRLIAALFLFILLVVVVAPMGLLVLFHFKPWPVVLWFALAYVICLGFTVRTWSRTLGVLAGLAVVFFVAALAARVSYGPSCRSLTAKASDPNAHPPYVTTDVELVDPGPPKDGRLHVIDKMREDPTKLGSRKDPNRPLIYANKFALKLDFRQYALTWPRLKPKSSVPHCDVLLQVTGLAIDSGGANGQPVFASGADNDHCLTPEQRNYLFHGLRIEVVELDGIFGRRPHIARAYDRSTNKAVTTVVFATAEPNLYGFPFNAYMPITCTSDDVRWTMGAALGVMPPLQPRTPDLALAVAVKAAYTRYPAHHSHE